MSDTLFFSAKRDFEEAYEDAESRVAEYNMGSSLTLRRAQLDSIRGGLDAVNKHLVSMEVCWESLPSSDKGYFKSELVEHRHKYDELRDVYFE